MYFSTKIDNRNDYGRETSAEEYELADGLFEQQNDSKSAKNRQL